MTVSEVKSSGSNWTLRIEPLQVGFMPLQNTPGSSLCPVRMKQNHVCLEARKQALTRHRICQRLDLARLRFQNDEKEMSGISTPICLWYFITHYSGITLQISHLLLSTLLLPDLETLWKHLCSSECCLAGLQMRQERWNSVVLVLSQVTSSRVSVNPWAW